MRRTPLTAMLTLLAALASTLVVAGCGGKARVLQQAVDDQHAPATTTTHKHSTKPAY